MNEIEKREITYEPDKTGLIAKIIFVIFGLIVFAGIGFYFYYDYNSKKKIKEVEDISFVDKEFNTLFKNDEKKKEQEPNEVIDYVKNNCYIKGVMISSGEKIKLYSKNIVGSYEKCENYAKERLCDDGFMSGDSKFQYPTCKVDVDCLLPDGTILKHNESRKFYSKKQVPFGITCEKYALYRICKNTVLTGDDNFIYNKCSISYDNSCALADGHILANNQSHLFYKKNNVPFGEKCSENAVRLMCTDAVMQGGDIDKYKYWDCSETAPKDCYVDRETTIKHGSSRALYSKEYSTETRDCNFFKEVRACYNGKLDGQPEYSLSKCYDN